MSHPSDLDASLGPAPHAYAHPEILVLRLRRHGRRLVLPVIALIIVAAVAGFWVGSLPELWMNLTAAGGAALVALVLGIMPILAWLTRRVTVTSRRVILRHGFFVRHRSEVPFSRVREVRSRRGPVQRLFGSGSVDLFVGSESIRLPDVPRVGLVTDALQELVERNYEHSTQQYTMPGGPGGQPSAQGGAMGAGMAGTQGFVPGAGIPHQTRPPGDPSAPVSFW